MEDTNENKIITIQYINWCNRTLEATGEEDTSPVWGIEKAFLKEMNFDLGFE